MLILALTAATALAQVRPISPEYPGNCQSPSWSKDGGKLSYEVNYHDKRSIELYVYTPGQEPKQIRPTGGRSSALTAGFSTTNTEQVAHELSWAPTSMNTFIYSASGSGQDYDLYLDRGSALAVSPGADGGASWSPNGQWIAFTSARTGQGDLYLVDIRHAEQPPRQLTTTPTSAELYATWSPDSAALVYVGHSDRGDQLYLIDDVTVGASRQIVALGKTQTRPSFSPDGRWLAFYSNHTDPDRFDLYVIPVDGGSPKQIAQGVVLNHRGPTWTPEGSHLIYVLDDDNNYDPIWSAPVAAPERARLINTGTIGNSDLDVVRGSDGNLWLAVAAQGTDHAKKRDYKRIYIAQIPNL
ncbi:MAG: hypothetical protein AAFV53_30865 [Myxococcota bacterium]